MLRIILATLLCCFHLYAFAVEKKAVFAGGCFWCMEKPYDKIDGVKSTISGYTGGHTENPTYESTSTGTTGHYEALEVTYDSDKVSYEKLLDVFWKNIDPLMRVDSSAIKGLSIVQVFLPMMKMKLN